MIAHVYCIHQNKRPIVDYERWEENEDDPQEKYVLVVDIGKL